MISAYESTGNPDDIIQVETVKPHIRLNRPANIVVIPLDVDEMKYLEQLKSRQPWLNVPPPIAPVVHHEPTLNGLLGKQHKTGSFEELDTAPFQHRRMDDHEYWQEHFLAFCTDACLLRYLRAHSWNVEHAYNGIVDTLVWRRKYQPHLIRPDEIADEAASGKQYHNGFSKDGMPIIYIRQHLQQGVSNYARGMRYLVFSLEHAIAATPEGVEKVILIFDFRQFSHSTATPMSVSKYFLHLFATHYPERLGFVFPCGAPWYFWAFYKVISPFINPVTKSKFRFVDLKSMKSISEVEDSGTASNLLNFIDALELEREFGGENNFKYNQSIYWPQMLKFHSEEFEQ